MAKSKALADLVGAEVAQATRRSTWWDYLPEEARKELLAVRQRFQAGEYGSKAKALTVARMLIPHCEESGWRLCDSKRMSEWLRAKD